MTSAISANLFGSASEIWICQGSGPTLGPRRIEIRGRSAVKRKALESLILKRARDPLRHSTRPSKGRFNGSTARIRRAVMTSPVALAEGARHLLR